VTSFHRSRVGGQLDIKPRRFATLLQRKRCDWSRYCRAGAFLEATSPMPRGVVPALEAVLPGNFPTALNDEEFNLFHLLDARRLVEIERSAARRSGDGLKSYCPCDVRWTRC
jgi:hypothetical protein